MSNPTVEVPPSTTAALAKRDLAVDFARVVSVVVVVMTHMLMVGVGIGSDGNIIVSEPLTPQPWFPVATLFLQIMPLFFILGGFSSLTSWRSLQRRGGTAADYIRNRVIRLARPAIPVFIFFAVAINVTAAFVDPTFLNGVVTGIGTPLWFVAAYILCQLFVPLMARLHEAAPWRTLAALAAGAVLVDALRYSLNQEWIGLANLFFVWLFVSQLGFLYADGFFFRIGRARVAAIGAAAAAVLSAIIISGLYVADMLHNLNPPTVPLMLLGVIQISVLVLIHPALTKLMQRKPARVFTFLFGTRLMTIYLWHMTCLILVTGVTLLIPDAAPAPATEGWWLSRPFVLIATFILVFILSKYVARFENDPVVPRKAGEDVSLLNAVISAALVFAPAFYVMRNGLDGYVAVAGVIAFTAAVLLVIPRKLPTA
ncbi:acyltransferase family protein [Leifsonia sp. Leaf264]|uniref:acyltransferase family protein n=1 Tax=Leifsonia sp. Leaf264 TaxID=1736314 RepID=UPI0006F238F8|nr:acyltransferase [Leifsonia sp. Leaf264]KQO98202.1 hypothetical protein ASF30_09075 [Leifsonia sp. Leaf264]